MSPPSEPHQDPGLPGMEAKALHTDSTRLQGGEGTLWAPRGCPECLSHLIDNAGNWRTGALLSAGRSLGGVETQSFTPASTCFSALVSKGQLLFFCFCRFLLFFDSCGCGRLSAELYKTTGKRRASARSSVLFPEDQGQTFSSVFPLFVCPCLYGNFSSVALVTRRALASWS